MGGRGREDRGEKMSEYRDRDRYTERNIRRIRRERRRKKQLKRRMILGGAVVAGVVVISVVVSHFAGGGKSVEPQASETESLLETTFQASDISVNGISLNGMTREQAREAIRAQYPWNVTVTYNGESLAADNLIDTELEKFLDEICGEQASGDYTFTPADSEALQEEAALAAKNIAAKWDVSAKNSAINDYDAASDKFLFSDGTPGRVVNQEKLAADLVAAVTGGDYDAVIEAQVSETQPELSAKEARSRYEKLASFTTNTTANEKRNTNVRLAAEALNGTIVQPGEEFSFNKVVGQRTAEKGYQEASAYNSGEVVQEVGGGVCQISSTLYHVVFQAGMKITYRRSHTFEPNYVTPGQDAAISWDLPDFRFVNTSDAAVGIRAGYSNRKATVAIYGVPVLEKGVTLSLESEKVEELPPPEPTYVEDQTLQPGQEVTQKAGTNGSRWVTYKVVKKNGEVIERTEDHSKTYKGHAAVIRRNTSDVVLAPEETTPQETTVAPTVDGMPDDYVPGESVAPESSAASPLEETTAASTESTDQATSPAETSAAAETTAAETTAAAPETTAAPGPAGPASEETTSAGITQFPGPGADGPGGPGE